MYRVDADMYFASSVKPASPDNHAQQASFDIVSIIVLRHFQMWFSGAKGLYRRMSRIKK